MLLPIELNGESVLLDTSTMEVEFNPHDYPDFTDSFAIHAEDNLGNKLTDDQIDYLNSSYPDIVYERVLEILY